MDAEAQADGEVSAEASTRPAPGTVLGPCNGNQPCPSYAGCWWPIGDCSAQPMCIVNEEEDCGGAVALPGCDDDGGAVFAPDCGPAGFANGPSSGTSWPAPDASRLLRTRTDQVELDDHGVAVANHAPPHAPPKDVRRFAFYRLLSRR